jgi:hypothetical protein
MAPVLIFRKDFAEIIVGIRQQGFQIEDLVKPVTGPLVFILFFWGLRLALVTKSIQQRVQEVIER